MRNNNASCRILAQGISVSNDTRLTGNNNNDLVIGPTGSGKTRGYVEPNIMQGNESMIVVDTKGNLMQKMSPLLKELGFETYLIDFKTMQSTCRWNPLDYIPYDKERQEYSEKDIAKVSSLICPVQNGKEPFWDHAAAQYLDLLISYVLDFLPEDEHSLEYVMNLFRSMDSFEFGNMMEEACSEFPESISAKYYEQIKGNATADKTDASIKCILSEHLHGVTFGPAIAMYSHPVRFRFRDLGLKKTVLFVNVSDTDRSMDNLVSLFFSQALQDLCDFADLECAEQRLPVPVRFILDDFATNVMIPDFDKIVSVIRSREIYTSIILQNITQLSGLYGQEKADTIIDNCDNILYLGGQSIETAQYVAARANLPLNAVLDMPLDEAYLFTRGRRPRKVHKFELESHARYNRLPEASGTQNTRESLQTAEGSAE